MTENSASKPVLPHETDPSLLEAFRYINSMPGKNVRGKMIDCFQVWMQVRSTEVLDAIKVSIIQSFITLWFHRTTAHLLRILVVVVVS